MVMNDKVMLESIYRLDKEIAEMMEELEEKNYEKNISTYCGSVCYRI